MTALTDEIRDLIIELRQIESRITELTNGSVDTVIDDQGMPFMLSQAQHDLSRRAEIHRQYAEQQAAILNAIPAHITLVDGEGNLIDVNEAWRHFGRKNDIRDPLFGIGKNYLKTCEQAVGDQSSDASAAAAGIRSVLLGERSHFSMEYAGHSPSRQQWFRLMVASLNSQDRHGAVIMHLDITERKLADLEMQRALSVFKSSNDGVLITDSEQIVLDANAAYSRITGYEKTAVIGRKIKFVLFELQASGLEDAIAYSLKTQGFWRGEVRNRRLSGEPYIENLSISVVYDDLGLVLNYIAVFSDITQSKAHEAELDHVANHDLLTSLPNRRLLTDRLQQAMAKARRQQQSLAVCYIDLDNFKHINDKLGHAIGDRVLIATSERLTRTLRNSDTVARIGGDEFILLLPDLKNEAELHALLRRLMAELKEALTIDAYLPIASASIGVVLFPEDDVDADTLLRHADQAMYVAKENGRSQYHVYDASVAREIESRNHLVDEIRIGLTNQEFVLFYQPKVNLANGIVIGFEALVRWQHPTKGLLSPGSFLPPIIGSSIESQFGEYVMRCAIEQLNEWSIAGHRLQVSVNVSANELRQANLFDTIDKQLKRFSSLEGRQLEIEVLETAAIEDMTQVILTLNRCKAAGIRVSLDDFGTGYSSLTIFRQLPVDILKIDQSFVRDMLTDQSDENIVKSVISMAQAFERHVIAEGVETAAQAARLIELGCLFGQGYGIAKPMPADQVLDWLSDSMTVRSYAE